MLKNPVTHEDHIQGLFEAPLTLIEYGDYQCPYCGLAYRLVKKIQEHFGERLRLVFRNFPLKGVHPMAEASAEAAEFAALHGRFWEMHDALYEHQQQLSLPFLTELAVKLKLPLTEFEQALASKTFEEKIQQEVLGGARSGVNGTPSFFVNDQKYSGPYDFKNMVAYMESV